MARVVFKLAVCCGVCFLEFKETVRMWMTLLLGTHIDGDPYRLNPIDFESSLEFVSAHS